MKIIKRKNIVYPGIKKLLMGLPKPLKGHKSTQFASTMQYINGQWLFRLWAFQYYGKKKELFRFKDVYRELEDGSKTVKDLYLSHLSGYYVCWEKERKGSYYVYEPSETWDEYCWERVPGVDDYSLINYESIIDKDPSLKYMAWDRKTFIMNYIRAYRINPSIELLSKNELSFIGLDKRFNKLSEEKKKMVIRFIRLNKQEILDRHMNLSDIFYSIKHNVCSKVRTSKKIQTAMKYDPVLSILHNSIFTDYEKSIDGYQFIIPKNSLDIINHGEYLGHCIKNPEYGYISDMASGNIVLVFVKKEDKPVATVEVSTTAKTIIQKRERFNKDCTEPVNTAIYDWLNLVYKPQKKQIQKVLKEACA